MLVEYEVMDAHAVIDHGGVHGMDTIVFRLESSRNVLLREGIAVFTVACFIGFWGSVFSVEVHPYILFFCTFC